LLETSKKTTFYPFLFFSEKKEQIEDFFGTASPKAPLALKASGFVWEEGAVQKNYVLFFFL
jgi:hypothetical protein